MIGKSMQAMQKLMITSVTHHQQCFSTRNTKVNGRKNAAPITQGMIRAAWRLPRRNPKIGVAMRRELVCECVSFLLYNPRYIFIVRRLSILSKLNSNNPYRIWVELHFPNLNYLIIPDTWPIRPSIRLHRSRFAS
jgi:hypothetical protein